jgi:hypothetical protein
MYRLHYIKHNVLAMLLLVSLCFTFSYEAQAHTTTTQIALVDTQTGTKISGVSYIPLVRQAKMSAYIPLFVVFSFERLLQSQDDMITRILYVQEMSTHTIQHTAVLAHVQQHTTLSDDTDTSFSPVTLS